MEDQVQAKLDGYPRDVYERINAIRMLIFEVVEENKLEGFCETLKWGELAYISKEGSTLRLAWKAKTPDQVSLYVNCQTSLIETFQELYGDVLVCVGKREIVFEFEKKISEPIVKDCILKTLRYHKVKHLPLLGA